ncbi:MAG: hypothetical protein Q9169_008589, partial [Polycauliona sp. 2 TL-2023]
MSSRTACPVVITGCTWSQQEKLDDIVKKIAAIPPESQEIFKKSASGITRSRKGKG